MLKVTVVSTTDLLKAVSPVLFILLCRVDSRYLEFAYLE